jgi:hypothetical protein
VIGGPRVEGRRRRSFGRAENERVAGVVAENAFVDFVVSARAGVEVHRSGEEADRVDVA